MRVKSEGIDLVFFYYWIDRVKMTWPENDVSVIYKVTFEDRKIPTLLQTHEREQPFRGIEPSGIVTLKT
ncbi:hypothetical protein P3T23_003324 [Paraburkholderia sp. GAS448]